MRIPPQQEIRPNSATLLAQQFHVPIIYISILDLLDGAPDSPQDHPHKSRMTLMSPEEWEIVRCNPHQLEMMPDSLVLDLEQSPIPHHTRQVACFTLGKFRDSLRPPFQI